jgi:hypothetical protein
MWSKFEHGETIGQKGSEEGMIVLDEEHSDGARITLEKGGTTAAWSVTCGIYGSFMHTAFASKETEGKSKYDRMKEELVQIMEEENDETRYCKMSDFADKY